MDVKLGAARFLDKIVSKYNLRLSYEIILVGEG